MTETELLSEIDKISDDASHDTTDGALNSGDLKTDKSPTDVSELQARIAVLEQELFDISNKGKLIAQELDLFRQRRVVFWSDRFRNTYDAWNLMNQSFQQLKDDTLLFHKDIRKFRLQPSYSLLRVAYLSYSLQLDRPNLCGILLGAVLDVPIKTGELCIRIFSDPDNLVASCNKPVSEMINDEPVLFEFPPIPNSDTTKLHMRVYVQGVDAPVRIFELRYCSFGGFGRLQTKPFAGLVFTKD